MQSITLEQYEQYKGVLGLEDDYIDIRYIIYKYAYEVCNYYHAMIQDVYDINELDLIIDAFLYFSGFDLSIDKDRIANILLGLGESKKSESEISDAEMVAMYAFLISNRIMNESEDKTEVAHKCQVLYKLISTIEPIEEYEKQYGDVKTMIKEFKEKNI